MCQKIPTEIPAHYFISSYLSVFMKETLEIGKDEKIYFLRCIECIANIVFLQKNILDI